VERAEGGSRTDPTKDGAFASFLKDGKSSLSPYEVMRIRQGAGEPAPDRFSNGKYTLGDRVKVQIDFPDSNAPNGLRREERQGLVWVISPDLGGKPQTLALVDGNTEPWPVRLDLDGTQGGPWWEPSKTHTVKVASHFDDPNHDPEQFRATWVSESERERKQGFFGAR
jgi:hypothetical protein